MHELPNALQCAPRQLSHKQSGAQGCTNVGSEHTPPHKGTAARCKGLGAARQRCRTTGTQKMTDVASARTDLSAGGTSGLNSHSTIGSAIGRWLCGS